MSYILDALRKSEQERMRGKLPDLNRFGEDDPARKTIPRWAVVVGSVLLVSNVVAIGAWLMRSPAVAPEQAKSAVPSTQDANGAVASRIAQSAPAPGSNTNPVGGVTSNVSPINQANQASAPAIANTLPGSTGSTPAVAVTPTNTQATAVVAAPPTGTVYYVAPQGTAPGQQIVVLPAGAVAPAVVAPGTVVAAGAQGNVVYQLPVAGQPTVGVVGGVAPSTVQNAWNSSGTAVQPPPPVPPPPVNLEQPVDGLASSELQGGNMSAGRATPASMPAVSYMPKLEELPPGLRQQVPDMSFSSHMFSSMPRFRSVVINGTRMREGQTIGNNLQINEITETGVILSINGTPFQVDVLGKWSQ